MDANFAQPARYRRMRHFVELFRGSRRPSSTDLAARLAPWHGNGDYAWLFDNEADELDLDARTLGFDLTQILDDPAARTPAMMYLFHRVEQRLDGEPAIIVIDEGWKALDDDVFVQRIKDWEKTIRKRNGIVGFCTQSAQDALGSAISSAIIEQAATQIFMINPKAQEADYCGGFGLTPHEFELVRTLPDSTHCFLIKHGADSVVARLNLAGMPDLLTVLSGRESSVRRLDELARDARRRPGRLAAPASEARLMAGACPVPGPDDPLVRGLLDVVDCNVQALVPDRLRQPVPAGRRVRRRADGADDHLCRADRLSADARPHAPDRHRPGADDGQAGRRAGAGHPVGNLSDARSTASCSTVPSRSPT